MLPTGMGAAGGNILPRLGTLLSERGPGHGGVSLRRLMVETLVIVLAAVGIFLVRQRGLEPAADAEGLGGFDPFLTSVPVLLALAGGVALLRLYPYPMRLLAAGNGPVHGPAPPGLPVDGREPSHSRAVAGGRSIGLRLGRRPLGDRARVDLVWRETRADVRLDVILAVAQALPDVDLTGAPGVEAQAREFRTRDANLTQEGLPCGTGRSGAPSFSLLAVESNEFQEIVRGSAAEVVVPSALLSPQDPGEIGTQENPIPAIVTSAWPERAGERPGAGDLLHVRVSAPQLSGPVSVFVRVAASRAAYPGVNRDEPFIVVRWDAFAAAVDSQPARPIRPTTIYLGGAGFQRADLDDAIRDQALLPLLAEMGRDAPLGIAFSSRTAALERLRDAPLARGLANSFRLSVALAAIYGGLVVIVALILTARERSRDLGYIRTLGLDSRQALGMTVTETVPGVLLACGLAVPLGIAIVRLVEPGLDLRAFVGPDVAVAIAVDRATAIAVAAGLALVALLAVAIFSALARRVQLGEVLRVE